MGMSMGGRGAWYLAYRYPHRFAAVAAAFDFGAAVVEIDVHSTTDGDFAVFHDRTLDWRTDGSGVVREPSMDKLKVLDVAYGYTFDGGRMDFRLRSVEGLNSPEQLERLPVNWRAGIFTDRIEVIGPRLKRDRQPAPISSGDHP